MKILLPLVGTALLGAGLFSFAPTPAADPSARPVRAAKTLAVDPVHSSILFKTKHVGMSWSYGRFNAFSGEVHYDEADPSKSSIVIDVQAASVDSGNGKRDDHLRSPDFLSAKEFPAIVFESTKVAKKDGGLAVTGDLTLHGVTHEVTADVEVVGIGPDPMGGGNGTRAGFHGTFEIDPADFEIAFMTGERAGMLGPKVYLTVSLECTGD